MFNDLFINLANFFLAQAPNIPIAAKTVVSDITVKSQGAHPLVIFLYVIYFICAIALVVLVMLQPAKSEGLGGVFGDSMQNLFRGKQSAEESISKITSAIGITFVLLSIIICLVINRFGA